MIARALGANPATGNGIALETERKLGRRVIRRGDVVAITGKGHARVRVEGHPVPGFRVLGFRGDDVHVFGAETRTKTEGLRVFPVDRIGRRPRPKT